MLLTPELMEATSLVKKKLTSLIFGGSLPINLFMPDPYPRGGTYRPLPNASLQGVYLRDRKDNLGIIVPSKDKLLLNCHKGFNHAVLREAYGGKLMVADNLRYDTNGRFRGAQLSTPVFDLISPRNLQSTYFREKLTIRGSAPLVDDLPMFVAGNTNNSTAVIYHPTIGNLVNVILQLQRISMPMVVIFSDNGQLYSIRRGQDTILGATHIDTPATQALRNVMQPETQNDYGRAQSMIYEAGFDTDQIMFPSYRP